MNISDHEYPKDSSLQRLRRFVTDAFQNNKDKGKETPQSGTESKAEEKAKQHKPTAE